MRQHDEARGKTSNTSTGSSNAPARRCFSDSGVQPNPGDEPRLVAETCSSQKE
jgi:hypothetical protein